VAVGNRKVSRGMVTKWATSGVVSCGPRHCARWS